MTYVVAYDSGKPKRWKPYGNARYRTAGGVVVDLYRSRQRCRFYTDIGVQVGPEQTNVFQAICYAHANGWWDLDAPAWLNLGCQRECGYSPEPSNQLSG